MGAATSGVPAAGAAQSAGATAQHAAGDPLAAAMGKAEAAATSSVPGASQAQAAKGAVEQAKDETADAAKKVGRALDPKDGDS